MPQQKRLTLERFKEAADKARVDGEETGPIVIPKGFAVEVKAVEGEDNVREFVASTGGVDRESDTLAVDGWELSNFAKAGVFLWAHERKLPPIGDPFATFVEGSTLKTRVRFPAQDMNHPLGMGFGHTVMRMYDERLMKGVSVGFLPIEWTFNEERGGFMPMDFKRQELVEISAAPTIANVDALAIANSKGIDTASIVAWAETVRDDTSGLWVSKEAVESLLDQAAGSKTISIPSPTPDTDPAPTPTSTEPGEATLDPAEAYAAATKAAEDAESKIIDAICTAIKALASRGSKGLVSDGNAERLTEAVAKADEMLNPRPRFEITYRNDGGNSDGDGNSNSDGDGDGQDTGLTPDQFKAMAEDVVGKLLAKHTGRLPV